MRPQAGPWLATKGMTVMTATEARWSALKDYLNEQVEKMETLGVNAPERDQLALSCTVGSVRMVLMKMRQLEDSSPLAAKEG
jgi:hypothetical protein